MVGSFNITRENMAKSSRCYVIKSQEVILTQAASIRGEIPEAWGPQGRCLRGHGSSVGPWERVLAQCGLGRQEQRYESENGPCEAEPVCT